MMRELIVDNFAGGGGASSGIKLATGRDVDIAVNHDGEAVLMHLANHPGTRHYVEDVWNVDPRAACEGRPVGLAWFSPDCKHFSKAKGGKPVSARVRGLAWLAVRWANLVSPRVIIIENVEEFRTWGPLAEDGRPCPVRKGQTFERFVACLRSLGYEVQWRELRACDYGAPTTRKRLFIIARRDGEPIVWPQPSHGPGRLAYRTAADCIDWTIPCPSIFERARPLAPATLRRIAKGVIRYVVDNPRPFIVPVTHTKQTNVHPIDEPLRTITTAKGGELALVAPSLVCTGNGERHGRHGEQSPRARSVERPWTTVTASGSQGALVAAFLAKHNGIGRKMVVGQDLAVPAHTITAVDQKALVTSNIIKLRGGGNIGQSVEEPLRTISAGGTHFAEVRAFLIKYYGTDQNPRLDAPLATVTTKDRFGLVTVHGEDYAIVDIGMRMLSARELFRAQGFPDDYVIGDDPAQGLILTKRSQVRMVGNSVCPPIAEALVRANYAAERIRRAA